MTDDASAIHADHPHICLMHRHSKLLSCLSLALFSTTCLATAALEAGYETAAIATTVQPTYPARFVNSRRPLSLRSSRKTFSSFRTIHPFLNHSYSTFLSASFLPPSSQPALSFFPLFSSSPSSHRIRHPRHYAAASSDR